MGEKEQYMYKNNEETITLNEHHSVITKQIISELKSYLNIYDSVFQRTTEITSSLRKLNEKNPVFKSSILSFQVSLQKLIFAILEEIECLNQVLHERTQYNGDMK